MNGTIEERTYVGKFRKRGLTANQSRNQIMMNGSTNKSSWGMSVVRMLARVFVDGFGSGN